MPLQGEPTLSAPLDRRGLISATAAFVLWGLMPLYWHLLKAVPSLQIIAHRIVWSALLVAGWLTWRYGRGWLRETLRYPRAAWMLALSGIFIAFNWGLYIWAVNAGHVVETSLGYFINPLLNVVLIRKIVAVPPVRGLGVESLYLFLPGLAFLLWTETHGQGGFVAAQSAGGWGVTSAALLVFGGALTAIPLIAFADAVQRIPFSMVGLMQYIAPTLQLLCGVLVFGEPFGSDRMIGFAVIWLALAIFAIEGFVRSRRRPAVRAT